MNNPVYFKDLKKTHRSQAIGYKYSSKIIELVMGWFPRSADAVLLADKEMREKRLFGDIIINEGVKAIQLQYQNGVLKMYYLQKEVSNGSNVISKISVMNDSVIFGKGGKE